MLRIIFFTFILIPFISLSQGSGKIKVYFTRTVDNSVSTGANALQLDKAVDDTLVAYINRTKYTMDIAIYNYTYASTIADIAGALNNAYNRGVKIRIIYDGSVGNTGLKNISSSIPMLASPQGGNYNIMHNKFISIDAKSVNPDDAIVWTGSTNWSNNMFYLDANNVVIIQDQPLALAYRTEFEEMWGDTGMIPNVSKSKFGKYKTDNTPHQFLIDGKVVELYFSPSDDVNTKIDNTLQTADTDLEFCLLQFTRSDLSGLVASKVTQGVIGRGLVDPSSLLAGKAAFDTMQSVMGNNLLTEKQTNSLLHHKYLIVDQSNTKSDPIVLTGSHNWTTSANTTNDENTLIIHDSTIANLYYQEFVARFKENGGVMSVIEKMENNDILVYPNPASTEIKIEFISSPFLNSTVEIFDLVGHKIFSKQINANNSSINVSGLGRGVYFIKISSEDSMIVKKVILN